MLFCIVMADMIAVLNAILFATGISEVFLALGIIACGIAQIFLYSRLHPIGHCIWTGIFFLAAAALAIIAAITRVCAGWAELAWGGDS